MFNNLQWGAGGDREKREAELDAQKEEAEKTKATRAARTFMPDAKDDDKRKMAAYKNKRDLLDMYWERSKTDAAYREDFDELRYLTPNERHEIVIDEARELWFARQVYDDYVNAKENKKDWNYALLLREHEKRLIKAEKAFKAILPELLKGDENYYSHVPKGKTPQNTFGLNRYNPKGFSSVDAPKVGEQTDFYRKHGQPLDEAADFWNMSAKSDEKLKYAPDIIDKFANGISSFFKF